MRYILSFCIFIVSVLTCSSQVVPEHNSNTGIYAFIDELASLRVFSLNSSVQPYSRTLIASCLDSARAHRDRLNPRQQKELSFYCQAYALEMGTGNQQSIGHRNLNTGALRLSLRPYGITYRDSLFRFQLQPILGGQAFHNASGNVTHRWWGASMHATMGNHLAIYASLRDNWETEILAKPTYLTTRPGGNYKVHEGGRPGGDFSEMRGGITWAWKWGYIGLIKDHTTWGSGYHSPLILSGRTPSFAQIRLNLKPVRWAELNYIHGWLVSEVVDSSRSYITPQGSYRKVYRNKYLASNFITISPWRDVNFSFGNSIVYSDMDVQPAYLIPLMFYKSIDHTLNHNIDNQNSQMFFDLSIHRIRHLHLYGTFFVDEWKTSRIFHKNEHNFLAEKAGFRLSGWPFENLTLTAEYTRINPVVYKHRIPSLTYASNQFILGNYLGSNSDEIYTSLSYRPLRGLELSFSWWNARKGNDYDYVLGNEVATYPVLKDIIWQNRSWSFSTRYEFLPNAYLFAEYLHSNITAANADGYTAQYYLDLFTPVFYQGNRSTFSGGFCFGF